MSELPAVATLTVTSGHSTLSSEITLKKTTDRGGYITGVFVSANVCVIASDMAKSLYRNCVVMETIISEILESSAASVVSLNDAQAHMWRYRTDCQKGKLD